MAKLSAAQLEGRRWRRDYERKRAMKREIYQTLVIRSKNLEECREVLSDMLHATSHLWKEGSTFIHANTLLLRDVM